MKLHLNRTHPYGTLGTELFLILFYLLLSGCSPQMDNLSKEISTPVSEPVIVPTRIEITDSPKDPVEELINALNAADIDGRKKAIADLVEMGAPAVE